MNETIDNDILIEKVNLLMTEPESIDPEELQQLMSNPRFVSMWQTALDAKRAIAEDKEVMNADKAYQEFADKYKIPEREEDTKDYQQKRHATLTPLYKYVIIAAACVAALLVFTYRHAIFDGFLSGNETVAQDRSDRELYVAEKTSNDILISSGKKTIDMTSLAANRHTAESLGITVQGDEIRCNPVDFDDYEISSNTILLPQGKVAKIVLPDGSRVWLNARSSLIYPNKFLAGQPRRVKLNGEAYFEVAHDKSRPFIVETEKVQTRVLGTSFNVRSYNNENPIVTLVNGSVQVSVSKGIGRKSSTILKPGQQWLLSEGKWTTMDVDTNVFTCWRDELFYFDGQTLREIMVEIGRWYNMTVLLDNNVHINDRLHFNGERTWTIQELIDQMNMVCKTKIRIEGDSLKVY
ncbi:MAG: FecR domain-containing protein [Prevotella sp.]|nr:FecR domain-containing protein [Prevotella sp.]MBQ9223636.1 FecR domain-containing protein [Prevotella sp.]